MSKLENRGSSSAAEPSRTRSSIWRQAPAVLALGLMAVVPLFGGRSAMAAGDIVRVSDFGAKGDGVTDDTVAIQTAIKHSFDTHAKRLEFDGSKRYLLSNVTSQNALVFYGSNLEVVGNGAVLIKSSPSGGYWGDAVDICGLTDGQTYPILGKYQGPGSPAHNITLSGLRIEHTTQVPHMNSLGMTNLDHITVRNVTSVNAPQTAFAMVTGEHKNQTVVALTLDNCQAIAPGNIGFEVSVQNDGKGLQVAMVNCGSQGVRNPTVNFKEIGGRKAHVWYRAGLVSDDVSLTMDHCVFDDSAEVMTTQGANAMKIQDCEIRGGLSIQGSFNRPSNISLLRNRISLDRSKANAAQDSPLELNGVALAVVSDNEFGLDVAGNSVRNIYAVTVKNSKNLRFTGNKNLNARIIALPAYGLGGISFTNNVMRPNNSLDRGTPVLHAEGLQGLELSSNEITGDKIRVNGVHGFHFSGNACATNGKSLAGLIEFDREDDAASSTIDNNSALTGARTRLTKEALVSVRRH